MRMPILKTSNVVAVICFVILCTGCDSIVFSDAEQEAQLRFSAIKEGQTYDDVISRLGDPAGRIRQSSDSAIVYEAISQSTGSEARLDALPRDQWPPHVRFLPDRGINGSVLVFNEGTVTAFIFLDRKDVVEHVDVHTS